MRKRYDKEFNIKVSLLIHTKEVIQKLQLVINK